MSHEVESMFSVAEVPWHGLGVVLDNPPTIADAIKLSSGKVETVDFQVAIARFQTLAALRDWARARGLRVVFRLRKRVGR